MVSVSKGLVKNSLQKPLKPSIHLDEWIGQLKGSSSYELGNGLQWQAGYGILLSFGTRDLEWVVSYMRNQKEHHAKGTVHARLERTDDESP